VLLDRRLELIVVGDDNPIRIPCSLDEFCRLRIATDPELHRAIINRICAAQNFRVGITGIPVRANFPQIDTAPRFKILVQNMARRGCAFRDSPAMRERLMHDGHSHSAPIRARAALVLAQPHQQYRSAA
jgi:hypothetical protein